jgi:hypothetical protein
VTAEVRRRLLEALDAPAGEGQPLSSTEPPTTGGEPA